MRNILRTEWTKKGMIVIALLLLPLTLVNAQGDDEKPLGSVSDSVYYGECPSGISCLAQSLPGGGQGVITSGLTWWTLQVDGTGKTEVQSTVYTWELISESKLYQNHWLTATGGPNSKWSSGSNDSIDSLARIIHASAGNYWSNEAFGTIRNSSLMTWSTSVVVGKQL